jgi:hypothetical protein
MVLMYGEVRGHSELARQIYGERFPQKIVTSQNTNLCKRCEAPSRFRAFRNEYLTTILAANEKIAREVAEEEILYENENQPQTSTRHLANHLRVSQFVVWLLSKIVKTGKRWQAF